MIQPSACLPVFSWSDEELEMIRAMDDAMHSLPDGIREEVVVCFFDDLQRIGVRCNGVVAVRALEEVKREVVERYRQWLSAFRTGDEDVIRRVVHGESFSNG